MFTISSENKEIFKYIRKHVLVNSEIHNQYKLDPVELVLNISEGCNLTCPYCFAGQGSYGHESRWMTKEEAYKYTIEAVKKFPSLKKIKLFGGEPFMNIRAIEGVCQAVRENQKRNIVITTVTNMMIYSQIYVNIIKEYNIHITVSIDGPKEIHDKYRKFRNGRGSYDLITKNLNKYKDSGIIINNYESVYTLFEYQHGFSIGDIVDYLIKELKAEWVHVVPDVNTLTNSDEAESTAFLSALYSDTSELYRESVSSIYPAKHALMTEMLAILFEENLGTSWCQLGQQTITIAADGTVVPCYTLLSEADRWRMSNNINSLNEDNVPKSVIDSLLQGSSSLHQECDGCVLQGICRGCPGGEFSASHRFTNKSPVGCSFLLGALEGTLTGWREKMKLSQRGM
ncbi:radical SAM/SPASM domain-containing protein [Bifidobacterium vespertilionis]|uniref:Radical SAM protein n=1 Tax=Bifidobacterium vespertilionis TaxID=2562524 RepID=A0A5J5DSK5_9BIFI|nr:radical SAM protein [Bifidobacterium vespertilionis]KAA8816173.1 radical SAM protein [Bifidobacterium vespertilionis]KAA8821507.1 radical SAM protein [Bifidobacterium vespertilionis]